MIVKAKSTFFNGDKLYRKGDELEIQDKAFDPILMTEIKFEKKPVKAEPVKKTTKKKA